MREIFSKGNDGQLGDVNVNPLSVPASMGPTYFVANIVICLLLGIKQTYCELYRQDSTLIATLSIHCPLIHRLKLSRPMNQSGEGITREARDT